MSERLQVLMNEDELEEIKSIAERRQMTVSEWVRQALRQARRDEPRKARGAKLAALDAAFAHAFPTADIDQMLSEIAAGRDSA